MNDIFVLPQPEPFAIPASYAAAGTTGGKGDPGSPGEGYATRALMAARLAPALLDDVYLTEAGREGKFVVDLASNWTAAIAADTAQGIFVASTADATKVYVRKFTGAPHVNWWGAKGDYNGTSGTDNAAAFAACMAAVQALAQAEPDIGSVWYLGRSLSLRDGGRYYTSAAFSIISSLEDVDMTGAEIVVPANTSGIIINADNTDGDSSRTSGPFPYLLKLINPKVRGHNGSDLTKPGIWMLRAAFIYNPQVTRISGIGILIGQKDGTSRNTEANQNGWFVGNAAISNCGGGGIAAKNYWDANAGVCQNYMVGLCGGWAVEDASAIGNKWTGQSANCGLLLTGVNTIPSFTYSGGHNWALVVGQEANTNVTPSAARPDVWIDMGAAAGGDPAVPAWVSGMAMRPGGDVCTVHCDGAPGLDHIYAETGVYSIAQLNASTAVSFPVAPPVKIVGGAIQYADPIHGSAMTTRSAWRAQNTSADGTVTSSMQIGGAAIGGVNSFAEMEDSLLHTWKWEAPGFLRLYDGQSGQGAINISAPGAGINFGRSADQSGVVFFHDLALGYSNAGRIVDMNSAAPTTGNHAQGEIVFNNAPSAGGKVGWVCTATGTPGTWKPFGAIDA